MILKGSQRAGAKALADHLLNERDNDHVQLLDVRGFMATDLLGALREAQAIAKATQCTQYLFSLSFNPPESHVATEAELSAAVDRAEEALGLSGQPRAIVIHEKEGRRHAHAVWSRIDGEQLKAIPLPHFKRKLMALSKELYLEHGWDLPDGLKSRGGRSPLNFTLAEWQQAKRQDVDPREIKQTLRQAWERSDSAQGLTNALQERGFALARGDRRAAVALDTEGNIYALSRWAGVKAKDVRERIGDLAALPSVDAAKAELKSRLSDQMRGFIREAKERQRRERQPMLDEKTDLVGRQRSERQALTEEQQHRATNDAQARAAALRKGLKGLWDWLTGKRAEQLKEQALALDRARERDARERDQLARRQMQDRRDLQARMRTLSAKQRADRSVLARQVAQSLTRIRKGFGGIGQDRDLERSRAKTRQGRGLSLDH